MGWENVSIGDFMEKYIYKFDLSSDAPKYIQLAKHIKQLIDMNIIEDGEKLPSIRELSKFLCVNSVTIINVYKKLQNEGYAVLKMGSGTYAKRKEVTRNFKKEYSEVFKKLSTNNIKQYIDFSGEITCSDFFQVDTFKSVLNEVLDRDGIDALVYQEFLGYEGLRKSINKFFWDDNLNIENILIVSGAQQGIDIASKAMINVNDNIILEKPTYSGAISVFKGRRANIFEVDMLDDGIDLYQFEKILKKNKIKCFYTMSYFQNPTGMSYSLEKKKGILRLAEKYDFYIIEDDYLSELIYDDEIEYKSFKQLDDKDRVIYIKSFSKIFLPGIRLGYLIMPELFKENIQTSKINTDISTSSLMQRALEVYINKGFWKEHINNLNIAYKERYNYMEQCIKNILGDMVTYKSPRGGLNFFLKLSNEVKIDSMSLFYKCLKEGVILTPGVIFYKQVRDGNKFVRFGFSQVSEEQIFRGITVIKDVLIREGN